MSRIKRINISADGNLALSGSGKRVVKKWNTATGEAVGLPMEGREVGYVARSKDGTLIAIGGLDGAVRRWDASTGESIGEPIYRHSLPVASIVISDDRKLTVTV